MDYSEHYTVCVWCGNHTRLINGSTETVVKCPACGLDANPADTTQQGAQKKTSSLNKESRYRKQTIRTEPFSEQLTGKQFLGVDPGARYTGVVLRDNETVLYSTTLVRPKDLDIGLWLPQVLSKLEDILKKYADDDCVISVEGVTQPKGFKHGQRASIDPGHIVFTAAVFGAVVGRWRDAIVVEPGGNGSQHITQYPPALVNRRTAEQVSKSEVKTRNHERSAYDVAGKAMSKTL